jgi:phosphoribosylglycinamide formyltransferase-1
MALNIGVLISGSGTNLQAIIDAIKRNSLDATISVVISNNPKAYGLIRAKKHNIPAFSVPNKKFETREKHEQEIIKLLKEYGVELVVLAGYMRLITKEFLSYYPNKILNIHPAILPSFKGIDAQSQAFFYGVKIAGATVHFVDEEMDHGPIIIQGAVPVYPKDTREELAKRILNIEHRIYPQAISWIAEERISIKDNKVYLKNLNKPLADISNIMPCLINPPLEKGF